MRRGGLTALLFCLLVALPLVYAGWRSYLGPASDECYACARPIHAGSVTVAMVNGHARRFCCPACALTFREANGGAVTITQLAAYPTAKPLAPGDAYIVEGSRVNLCERSRPLIDADKHAADRMYDRCSPSMIAFARRENAAAFAAEHGGEVLPFEEAVSAADHRR